MKLRKIPKEAKAICRKVKKLEAKAALLDRQIALIQKDCPHPTLYKQYQSDTGNYCPQDDSYWTNFYCTTCGVRWREDGSSRRKAIECGKFEEIKDLPDSMLTDEELKIGYVAE